MCSAVLFWGDYNLRIINADAVVGIGGRASNLESVASWCGIGLTHPKMRVIGGARWNQSFENPRLPLNVKPIRGTTRFDEEVMVILNMPSICIWIPGKIRPAADHVRKEG